MRGLSGPSGSRRGSLRGWWDGRFERRGEKRASFAGAPKRYVEHGHQQKRGLGLGVQLNKGQGASEKETGPMGKGVKVTRERRPTI